MFRGKRFRIITALIAAASYYAIVVAACESPRSVATFQLIKA
jgi:hypothetical protein